VEPASARARPAVAARATRAACRDPRSVSSSSSPQPSTTRRASRLAAPIPRLAAGNLLPDRVRRAATTTTTTCRCQGRSEDGTEVLDELTRLRNSLNSAIEAEDYERAASIRDELKRLTEIERVQVADANSKFYEAFQTGRLADMRAIWGSGAHVRVTHPGSGCILGRNEVLSSWKHIFSVGGYKIDLDEVEVHVMGSESAMVTCVEYVDSGPTTGKIVATNVFQKEDGQWKIVHHHGSSSAPPLEENPWTI